MFECFAQYNTLGIVCFFSIFKDQQSVYQFKITGPIGPNVRANLEICEDWSYDDHRVEHDYDCLSNEKAIEDIKSFQHFAPNPTVYLTLKHIIKELSNG
jgi:hypothetical protein